MLLMLSNLVLGGRGFQLRNPSMLSLCLLRIPLVHHLPTRRRLWLLQTTSRVLLALHQLLASLPRVQLILSRAQVPLLSGNVVLGRLLVPCSRLHPLDLAPHLLHLVFIASP